MIKTRLGKKIAGTLAGLITLGGMVGCDRNISWGSINGHSSNVGYTNSGMGAVAFRAAGTPLGDALGSLAQAEHTAWQNANAVEERIRKINSEERATNIGPQNGIFYDLRLQRENQNGVPVLGVYATFCIENSHGEEDIMFIIDLLGTRDENGLYNNADGEIAVGRMLPRIEGRYKDFINERLFIPIAELHGQNPREALVRVYDFGLGRSIGAREFNSIIIKD